MRGLINTLHHQALEEVEAKEQLMRVFAAILREMLQVNLVLGESMFLTMLLVEREDIQDFFGIE